MAISPKEKEYAPTSHNFQPRYSGPSPNQMTPEQQSIRQSILNSRPNTGLSGPFGPWLSIPSIARPSQELGRTVRYGTSLSSRESELVILLTGAKFKSEAEFDIHVGEARRVGISWDVIQSIPRGRLLSEIDGDLQKNILLQEEGAFSLKKVKESVVPMLEKEHDNNSNNDGQHTSSKVEEYEEKMENSSINSNAKKREVAIVLFTAELLEKSTVSDETYESTKQALDGQDSALVEITSIIGYYAYVAYTLNVFKIPSNVKSKE